MRLFVLLAFIPSLLTAQSAFLKDPDIVWAAEIEQDWIVDIPSLEDEWDQGITTIKLLRTEKNQPYWSSSYLADLVFQAALSGGLPVFKDSNCQVPTDAIYSGKDTVYTFDPETYEEKAQVVWVEANPIGDFKAWRLRQVLAYHRKSATWSTTVEAIAPLVVVRNNQRDSIGLRPLFWFRPDNQRPKISSNHIVWVKKTRNKQIKTWVKMSHLPLVKVTDGFQNPLEHLLEVFKTDMKTPFYNGWDYKPLSPSERTAMMAKTDTVTILDSETYEEKTMVVHNDINQATFRQLRLVQTWYWDERRHRLSICLDGVAPLKDVEDELGNFRFSQPFFYQRARQ